MLLELLADGGGRMFIHAIGLVVLTATIHAIGFSALLHTLLRAHVLNWSGFLPATLIVILLTCWLTLIHLLEIYVWAHFYVWQGCLPDIQTALYFSGTTYTTVGFGDLVLPQPWRVLAPIEALTGIIMCGLSTGLFFALVSRWITAWAHKQHLPTERHSGSRDVDDLDTGR